MSYLFSDKLLELCAKSEVSNEELAKEFEVAPTVVARWKNGVAKPHANIQNLVIKFLSEKIKMVADNKIRAWMKKNSQECRDSATGEMNSTMLAEQCAEALDLYVGDDCIIPDKVFEIAGEFK